MGSHAKMLAALLLVASFAGGDSYCQGAKKPDPFGEATIRVKGFGRFAPGEEGTPRGELKAAMAARRDAQRNVAALFGKIEVRGDDRVKRIVISGLVSGAREVGAPEVKGGWVIVTVEIPLSAIASNMADLHEKIDEAKKRNERLQQALGKADSSVAKLRKTLDDLKRAIDGIEAKFKEMGK